MLKILLYCLLLILPLGASAQTWTAIGKLPSTTVGSACLSTQSGKMTICDSATLKWVVMSTGGGGGGSSTLSSAIANAACPSNGIQGYDSGGAMYICVNSLWAKAKVDGGATTTGSGTTPYCRYVAPNASSDSLNCFDENFSSTTFKLYRVDNTQTSAYYYLSQLPLCSSSGWTFLQGYCYHPTWRTVEIKCGLEVQGTPCYSKASDALNRRMLRINQYIYDPNGIEAQTAVVWSPTLVSMGTPTSSGKANTNTITAYYGVNTTTAAGICASKGSGWYLPSLDDANAIGGSGQGWYIFPSPYPGNNFYWTSTDYGDTSNARIYGYSNGSGGWFSGNSNKITGITDNAYGSFIGRVRCLRSD